MARQHRVDDAKKRRIAEKRFREARKYGTRLQRKKYLIVCEGTKTEPKYFEGLERSLPKGIVDIEIVGTGRNTLTVVETAIELKKEQIKKAKKSILFQPYDKIWVVYDKDDFPSVNFNNAIFKARANKISVAYSNEAFELWYLLHFQYHNTGISRNQYYPILTRYLGFRYVKNFEDMYLTLSNLGNEDQAIKWAEKLLKESTPNNPAVSNPSTTVHRLIKELNEYRNPIKNQ